MKPKKFKKFIAGLLVLLMMSEAWAADAIQARAASMPAPFQLDALKIPASLGAIDEVHHGTNEHTVLFIQDAHDSPEAQIKIAKIITRLIHRQHVKKVFEEGYEGKVPSDQLFGQIKDQKIRALASYYYLDKLRLGGAEYAHINRKKDFDLIGVESLDAYLKNLEVYREAAETRTLVLEDLIRLESELMKLAVQKLPSPAIHWLKLRKRFTAGKITLDLYLPRLLNSLKDRSRALAGLPTLQPLIELIESQSTEPVAKKLHDLGGIWDELKKLEEKVIQQMNLPVRDQRILNLLQAVELLQALTETKLSSDQFVSVRQILTQLNTQEVASFLAAESGHPILLSKFWQDVIHRSLKFYDVARLRDESVLAHIDNQMQESSSAQVSIFVFGGFHRERIISKLKAAGYSYAVITPRITKISPKHQSYYKQLMSNGKLARESAYWAPQAARPEGVAVLVRQNPGFESLFRSELKTLVGLAPASRNPAEFLLKADTEFQTKPQNTPGVRRSPLAPRVFLGEPVLTGRAESRRMAPAPDDLFPESSGAGAGGEVKDGLEEYPMMRQILRPLGLNIFIGDEDFLGALKATLGSLNIDGKKVKFGVTEYRKYKAHLESRAKDQSAGAHGILNVLAASDDTENIRQLELFVKREGRFAIVTPHSLLDSPEAAYHVLAVSVWNQVVNSFDGNDKDILHAIIQMLGKHRSATKKLLLKAIRQKESEMGKNPLLLCALTFPGILKDKAPEEITTEFNGLRSRLAASPFTEKDLEAFFPGMLTVFFGSFRKKADAAFQKVQTAFFQKFSEELAERRDDYLMEFDQIQARAAILTQTWTTSLDEQFSQVRSPPRDQVGSFLGQRPGPGLQTSFSDDSTTAATSNFEGGRPSSSGAPSTADEFFGAVMAARSEGAAGGGEARLGQSYGTYAEAELHAIQNVTMQMIDLYQTGALSAVRKWPELGSLNIQGWEEWSAEATLAFTQNLIRICKERLKSMGTSSDPITAYHLYSDRTASIKNPGVFEIQLLERAYNMEWDWAIVHENPELFLTSSLNFIRDFGGDSTKVVLRLREMIARAKAAGDSNQLLLALSLFLRSPFISHEERMEYYPLYLSTLHFHSPQKLLTFSEEKKQALSEIIQSFAGERMPASNAEYQAVLSAGFQLALIMWTESQWGGPEENLATLELMLENSLGTVRARKELLETDDIYAEFLYFACRLARLNQLPEAKKTAAREELSHYRPNIDLAGTAQEDWDFFRDYHLAINDEDPGAAATLLVKRGKDVIFSERLNPAVAIGVLSEHVFMLDEFKRASESNNAIKVLFRRLSHPGILKNHQSHLRQFLFLRPKVAKHLKERVMQFLSDPEAWVEEDLAMLNIMIIYLQQYAPVIPEDSIVTSARWRDIVLQNLGEVIQSHPDVLETKAKEVSAIFRACVAGNEFRIFSAMTFLKQVPAGGLKTELELIAHEAAQNEISGKNQTKYNDLLYFRNIWKLIAVSTPAPVPESQVPIPLAAHKILTSRLEPPLLFQNPIDLQMLEERKFSFEHAVHAILFLNEFNPDATMQTVHELFRSDMQWPRGGVAVSPSDYYPHVISIFVMVRDALNRSFPEQGRQFDKQLESWLANLPRSQEKAALVKSDEENWVEYSLRLGVLAAETAVEMDRRGDDPEAAAKIHGVAQRIFNDNFKDIYSSFRAPDSAKRRTPSQIYKEMAKTYDDLRPFFCALAYQAIYLFERRFDSDEAGMRYVEHQYLWQGMLGGLLSDHSDLTAQNFFNHLRGVNWSIFTEMTHHYPFLIEPIEEIVRKAMAAPQPSLTDFMQAAHFGMFFERWDIFRNATIKMLEVAPDADLPQSVINAMLEIYDFAASFENERNQPGRALTYQANADTLREILLRQLAAEKTAAANAEHLYTRTRQLVYAGNFEEAVAQTNALVQKHPDAHEIQTRLMRVLALGSPERAEQRKDELGILLKVLTQEDTPQIAASKREVFAHLSSMPFSLPPHLRSRLTQVYADWLARHAGQAEWKKEFSILLRILSVCDFDLMKKVMNEELGQAKVTFLGAPDNLKKAAQAAYDGVAMAWLPAIEILGESLKTSIDFEVTVHQFLSHSPQVMKLPKVDKLCKKVRKNLSESAAIAFLQYLMTGGNYADAIRFVNDISVSPDQKKIWTDLFTALIALRKTLDQKFTKCETMQDIAEAKGVAAQILELNFSDPRAAQVKRRLQFLEEALAWVGQGPEAVLRQLRLIPEADRGAGSYKRITAQMHVLAVKKFLADGNLMGAREYIRARSNDEINDSMRAITGAMDHWEKALPPIAALLERREHQKAEAALISARVDFQNALGRVFDSLPVYGAPEESAGANGGFVLPAEIANGLNPQILEQKTSVENLRRNILRASKIQDVNEAAKKLCAYPEHIEEAVKLMVEKGAAEFNRGDMPFALHLGRLALEFVYARSWDETTLRKLQTHASWLASHAAAQYWLPQIERDYEMVSVMAAAEKIREDREGSGKKPHEFKRITLDAGGQLSVSGMRVGKEAQFRVGDRVKLAIGMSGGRVAEEYVFTVSEIVSDREINLEIPKKLEEDDALFAAFKQKIKGKGIDGGDLKILPNPSWQKQRKAVWKVLEVLRQKRKGDHEELEVDWQAPVDSLMAGSSQMGVLSEILGLSIPVPKKEADQERNHAVIGRAMEKMAKLMGYDLDDVQKTALLDILSPSTRYAFVQGPPGTGKTTAILWMVKILHDWKCDMRLFAHANKAVDNALGRMLDFHVKLAVAGKPEEELNLARAAHDDGELSPNMKELWEMREDLYRAIAEAQAKNGMGALVAGTLEGMPNELQGFPALKRTFATLVDESGLLTLPEMFGAGDAFDLVGRNVKDLSHKLEGKMIMVGDHKQLPAYGISDEDVKFAEELLGKDKPLPNFRGRTVYEILHGFKRPQNEGGRKERGQIDLLEEYRTSFFERWILLQEVPGATLKETRELFPRTHPPFHRLVVQRRSRDQSGDKNGGKILKIINYHYDNELIAGRLDDGDALIQEFDTRGTALAQRPDEKNDEEDESKKKSWINKGEANIAVSVLLDKLSQGFAAKDVAIITPYRRQVEYILKLLKSLAEAKELLDLIATGKPVNANVLDRLGFFLKDEMIQRRIVEVQFRKNLKKGLSVKSAREKAEQWKQHWLEAKKDSFEKALAEKTEEGIFIDPTFALATLAALGAQGRFVSPDDIDREVVPVLTVDSSIGSEYKVTIISWTVSRKMLDEKQWRSFVGFLDGKIGKKRRNVGSSRAMDELYWIWDAENFLNARGEIGEWARYVKKVFDEGGEKQVDDPEQEKIEKRIFRTFYQGDEGRAAVKKNINRLSRRAEMREINPLDQEKRAEYRSELKLQIEIEKPEELKPVQGVTISSNGEGPGHVELTLSENIRSWGQLRLALGFSQKSEIYVNGIMRGGDIALSDLVGKRVVIINRPMVQRSSSLATEAPAAGEPALNGAYHPAARTRTSFVYDVRSLGGLRVAVNDAISESRPADFLRYIVLALNFIENENSDKQKEFLGIFIYGAKKFGLLENSTYLETIAYLRGLIAAQEPQTPSVAAAKPKPPPAVKPKAVRVAKPKLVKVAKPKPVKVAKPKRFKLARVPKPQLSLLKKHEDLYRTAGLSEELSADGRAILQLVLSDKHANTASLAAALGSSKEAVLMSLSRIRARARRLQRGEVTKPKPVTPRQFTAQKVRRESKPLFERHRDLYQTRGLKESLTKGEKQVFEIITSRPDAKTADVADAMKISNASVIRYVFEICAKARKIQAGQTIELKPGGRSIDYALLEKIDRKEMPEGRHKKLLKLLLTKKSGKYPKLIDVKDKIKLSQSALSWDLNLLYAIARGERGFEDLRERKRAERPAATAPPKAGASIFEQHRDLYETKNLKTHPGLTSRARQVLNFLLKHPSATIHDIAGDLKTGTPFVYARLTEIRARAIELQSGEKTTPALNGRSLNYELLNQIDRKNFPDGRRKELLKLLLSKKQGVPVRLGEAAAILQISPRTASQELSYLYEWAHTHGAKTLAQAARGKKGMPRDVKLLADLKPAQIKNQKARSVHQFLFAKKHGGRIPDDQAIAKELGIAKSSVRVYKHMLFKILENQSEKPAVPRRRSEERKNLVPEPLRGSYSNLLTGTEAMWSEGDELIQQAEQGEPRAILHALSILISSEQKSNYDYALAAIRRFPDKKRMRKVLRVVLNRILLQRSKGNWTRLAERIQSRDALRYKKYAEAVRHKILIALMPRYIALLGDQSALGDAQAESKLETLQAALAGLRRQGSSIKLSRRRGNAFPPDKLVSGSAQDRIFERMLQEQETDTRKLAKIIGMAQSEVTRALNGIKASKKRKERQGAYEMLVDYFSQKNKKFLSEMEQTFQSFIPGMIMERVVDSLAEMKPADAGREKEYLIAVVKEMAKEKDALVGNALAAPKIAAKITQPTKALTKSDYDFFFDPTRRQQVFNIATLNIISRVSLLDESGEMAEPIFVRKTLVDRPIQVGGTVHFIEAGTVKKIPASDYRGDQRPVRYRISSIDERHQAMVARMIQYALRRYSSTGQLPVGVEIAGTVGVAVPSFFTDFYSDVLAQLQKRGVPIVSKDWARAVVESRVQSPAQVFGKDLPGNGDAQNSASFAEVAGLNDAIIFDITFTGIKQFQDHLEKALDVQVSSIELRATVLGIQVFLQYEDRFGREKTHDYLVRLDASGKIPGFDKTVDLEQVLAVQGYPIPLVTDNEGFIHFKGQRIQVGGYFARKKLDSGEVAIFSIRNPDSRFERLQAWDLRAGMRWMSFMRINESGKILNPKSGQPIKLQQARDWNDLAIEVSDSAQAIKIEPMYTQQSWKAYSVDGNLIRDLSFRGVGARQRGLSRYTAAIQAQNGDARKINGASKAPTPSRKNRSSSLPKNKPVEIKPSITQGPIEKFQELQTSQGLREGIGPRLNAASNAEQTYAVMVDFLNFVINLQQPVLQNVYEIVETFADDAIRKMRKYNHAEQAGMESIIRQKLSQIIIVSKRRAKMRAESRSPIFITDIDLYPSDPLQFEDEFSLLKRPENRRSEGRSAIITNKKYTGKAGVRRDLMKFVDQRPSRIKKKHPELYKAAVRFGVFKPVKPKPAREQTHREIEAAFAALITDLHPFTTREEIADKANVSVHTLASHEMGDDDLHKRIGKKVLSSGQVALADRLAKLAKENISFKTLIQLYEYLKLKIPYSGFWRLVKPGSPLGNYVKSSHLINKTNVDEEDELVYGFLIELVFRRKRYHDVAAIIRAIRERFKLADEALDQLQSQPRFKKLSARLLPRSVQEARSKNKAKRSEPVVGVQVTQEPIEKFHELSTLQNMPENIGVRLGAAQNAEKTHAVIVQFLEFIINLGRPILGSVHDIVATFAKDAINKIRKFNPTNQAAMEAAIHEKLNQISIASGKRRAEMRLINLAAIPLVVRGVVSAARAAQAAARREIVLEQHDAEHIRFRQAMNGISLAAELSDARFTVSSETFGGGEETNPDEIHLTVFPVLEDNLKKIEKLLNTPGSDVYMPRAGSLGHILVWSATVKGKKALWINQVHSSRGFHLLPVALKNKYGVWKETLVRRIAEEALKAGFEEVYAESHISAVDGKDAALKILSPEQMGKKRGKVKTGQISERSLKAHYLLPFTSHPGDFELVTLKGPWSRNHSQYWKWTPRGDDHSRSQLRNEQRISSHQKSQAETPRASKRQHSRLGAQRRMPRVTEIQRLGKFRTQVKSIQDSATVWIDAASLVKLTPEQRQFEFEKTAVWKAKVKFVIYKFNPTAHDGAANWIQQFQKNFPDRMLVWEGDVETVPANWGDREHNLGILAPGKATANLRGWRWFRYQGSELELLPVALLYSWGNSGKNEKRIMTLSMLPQGLTAILHQYWNSLAFASAA